MCDILLSHDAAAPKTAFQVYWSRPAVVGTCTLSLRDSKGGGKADEEKINDVVMTIRRGAFAAYLEATEGRFLTAPDCRGAGLAAKGRETADMNNQVTAMLCNLADGHSRSIRRLEASLPINRLQEAGRIFVISFDRPDNVLRGDDHHLPGWRADGTSQACRTTAAIGTC